MIEVNDAVIYCVVGITDLIDEMFWFACPEDASWPITVISDFLGAGQRQSPAVHGQAGIKIVSLISIVLFLILPFG